MNLDCLGCRTAFTPSGFLACCQDYRADLDVLRWVCSHCGDRVDVRLAEGEVQRGYVYGAGSAHFSDEHHIPLPGLRREREGDGLIVTFGDDTRRIGPAVDR